MHNLSLKFLINLFLASAHSRKENIGKMVRLRRVCLGGDEGFLWFFKGESSC
jgi:hypothetical protein